MHVTFCPNCNVNHLRECTERPEHKGWKRCLTCGYMERVEDEREETKRAVRESEKDK